MMKSTRRSNATSARLRGFFFAQLWLTNFYLLLIQTMIFDKRVAIRPYEYPDLMEYAYAIRHAYWIHTEYNYTGDIQDYHTMTPAEKLVFQRTMLAIAHVEVSVKSFR